jgi:hypothetical protein
MQLRTLSLLGLVITVLGGCQGTPLLVAGLPTAMDPADNAQRQQLAVNPVPTPTSLVYAPIKSCSYQVRQVDADGAEKLIRSTVSVKRVKDRLLVVETADGKVSTVLINASGKILDFNKVDPNSSRRVTSETFDTESHRQLDELKAKNPKALGAHVIQDISLVTPEFMAARLNVGDTAAVVKAEDGSVWGTYLYRGVADRAGSAAIVLDLTHVLESAPQYGPVLVGYALFDSKTMLPLTLVLDAGFKTHLDQVSCQR